MEQVPEVPNFDAVLARMRGRMADHHQELLTRDPVFGLRTPPIAPGFLGESDNASVTLMFGDATTIEGPLIRVRTSRQQPGRFSSLPYLLEDEHERVRDHAGAADPPWTEPTKDEGELVVDGHPVVCRLLQDDQLWAAQLNVPATSGGDADVSSVVISVVSRGVAFADVQLTTVADLQPFLDRREEWIVMMYQRKPDVRAEDLELPPVSGLDAHRTLVSSSIADTAETFARLKAHRPPISHGDRPMREWESAVRAQMHLAEQSRDEANDAVSFLVNQMGQLSREAPWFDAAGSGAAAIEETIGYVVFDADVPSRPAQEAWRRFFEERRSPPAERPEGAANVPLTPEQQAGHRARVNTGREAKQAWIDAWAEWRRDRT